MVRALLLSALLTLAAAAPARAQVPAAADWATLESAHFRVAWTSGLEPLARHAAAAAERARAALLEYVATPPAGRVDIVLSDNVDVSNGSATVFPGNRIHIYARPPVDAVALRYLEDWLELVVTHELAHIFHLDVTSEPGRVLRGIFGRVPFDWPFFPAIGSPRWSVEGLAVAVESSLTSMGRLHGTYHDMVARTAALEGGIEDIDRLSSGSPLWPGAERVYIYGSLFLYWLEERHGPETISRMVSATAHAAIPPALWFDRVGTKALGVPFRTAYDEWRSERERAYRALADSLRAQELTATRPLITHGGEAAHPRFSPDGSTLAYTANDRRSTPVLRAVDVAGGRRRWEQRTNGAAGASWLDDHTVLAPGLEYADPEHAFFDLYRHDRERSQRLTRAARLQHADVHRGSGRVVAVRNDGGTNQLVLTDSNGQLLRALVPLETDVHWATPRWSPDGSRVAASRWSTGGRFDVVVLDTTGSVLTTVTNGVGVNIDPAWTPDGRFIVYSSDRTGIANLYAYDLRRDTTWQLTNLLTGAFHPDVSPDGRTIAASIYHADGYHIELLPFDTTTWRVPMPARLPQLPMRVAAADDARSFVTPVAARSTARAAAAGVADVDTLSSSAQPYRAWPTLRPHSWLPIFIAGETNDFVGIGIGGSDVVGRHAWRANLAVAPAGGATAGSLAWQYRGLRPIGSLKPLLQLDVRRDWERALEAEQPGDPFIDEREDLLSLGTALQHVRWRAITSAGISGEFVRRRRLLHDAPGLVLRDARDELLGLRLLGSFTNARSYPFGISPEDGVRLQLSARQRWDRSPMSFRDELEQLIVLDGSYRELTAWSAAYRSLGHVGFAHSVLALRASALWRDGHAASTHGVGGSSGSGIAGLPLINTGSEFLPVRGFESNTRRGLRAWSTSAEVRLPLALIARRPRPLPLFLHALSGALFLDAGNADCPRDRACGPLASGRALIGAGAELGLDAEVLGFRSTIRFGGALPLQGTADRAPRFHFQLGPAF